MNTALEDSEVNIEMNLVHIHKTVYEFESFNDDLANL